MSAPTRRGPAAPMTRRGLLATGALVAVGVGVGRQAAAGSRTADLVALRRADLDRHQGTYATIRRQNRPDLRVRLAGTRDLPHPVADPQSSFSARFTADSEEGLAQGTYVVAHRDLGRMLLFLVPAPAAGDAVEYEAVFYRPEAPGGQR